MQIISTFSYFAGRWRRTRRSGITTSNAEGSRWVDVIFFWFRDPRGRPFPLTNFGFSRRGSPILTGPMLLTGFEKCQCECTSCRCKTSLSWSRSWIMCRQGSPRESRREWWHWESLAVASALYWSRVLNNAKGVTQPTNSVKKGIIRHCGERFFDIAIAAVCSEC